jgi:hypothetical protein
MGMMLYLLAAGCAKKVETAQQSVTPPEERVTPQTPASPEEPMKEQSPTVKESEMTPPGSSISGTSTSLEMIHFDYDISELGNYLAGDFLLRDLDTLEHDLVVTQRESEQHVRYVFVMSREFPQALQELRDTGRVTFSMVLEQLERRFPGLILASLGAVDVVPIALMDQSRFSLRLTHQGFSRMRRRPIPGADSTEPWPAEPRLHGPETAIYSGLSRQDAASIFPVTTSAQRNAFEGRGAAGAWEIYMSMEENHVVPGSLADMLITFNIAGFFDADVRTEPVTLGPAVGPSYLSAPQVFSDNFYDFSRTGKMDWPLTRSLDLDRDARQGTQCRRAHDSPHPCRHNINAIPRPALSSSRRVRRSTRSSIGHAAAVVPVSVSDPASRCGSLAS